MHRQRLLIAVATVCLFAVSAISQTRLVWSSFTTGTQQNQGSAIELRSFVGQTMAGWSAGNGISLTSGPVGPTIASLITAVGDQPEGLTPSTLQLAQNFPNPFNPSTTLEFIVPTDGRATMRVYNMLGQLVATPFDGEATAGRTIRALFDATHLSGGFYVTRLEFEGKLLSRKMLLLK